MSKLQPKKYFVFVSLSYFFLVHSFNFIEDLNDGYKDYSHILYEGLISIISFIAIYIIWSELKINKKHIKILQEDLKTADTNTKKYSNKIQTLKHELFAVITNQFKEWSLSKSEQEIALLLIKGLSLEEISQMRNTKENTIRQQASTIYKKSKVNGRHELSAYFLEDLF